jgi:hypothetical protein
MARRRFRLYTFREIEERLFSQGLSPAEVSQSLDEEWARRASNGQLSRREKRTDLALRLIDIGLTTGDARQLAWGFRTLLQGPRLGPPRDPQKWFRDHVPFLRIPSP